MPQNYQNTITRAYLEPHEIEKLEQATTNLRDRLLVRLLFCLGCRISEAIALTVEDVNIQQGTVTIQHLKTIKRGGPVSRNDKQLIFGINRHRACQVIRDCAKKAGLPSLINSDTGG